MCPITHITKANSSEECCVCDSCMRLVDAELRNPLRSHGLRARTESAPEESKRSPADMISHRYIFMRCAAPVGDAEEAKVTGQVATEMQLAALQKSLADAVDRLTNLEQLVQGLKPGNSTSNA